MSLCRRFVVTASVIVAVLSVAGRVSEARQGSTKGTSSALSAVEANDNRTAAGVLKDGVLTLHLVASTARWQPEGQGPNDPVRIVQVFAEEGKSPQIPGPLVRVPEGTEIRMSVRNTLGMALRFFGAASRPCSPATFVEIPQSATKEFRFLAGKPGTYFYLGTTSIGPPLGFRFGNVDGALSGALIVDPASGREEPNDRIFVLGVVLGEVTANGLAASLSINGRSWPFTERQVLPFGQPATWRVINASFDIHPMHLHGTFYTVESLGNWATDTIYDHDSRRLVTTEALDPGATMKMRWVPDRVGNWLFHCHIQQHVTGDMRAFDMTPAEREMMAHGAHQPHDVEHSMAGLVLGVTVKPGDETAAPDLQDHTPRGIKITIDSLPNRYGDQPGFGFTVEDQAAASPPAPPALPGAESVPPNPSPTLVLEKGEPVAITLVNKTDRETSIHWHGIELESLNDGVAGWSGDSRQTTKPIPPGESLYVWFTPPREGTFMYHTHAHDRSQLSSGMYAALLVVPDRHAFNPEVEKVVLLGGSGPKSADFSSAPFEINRSTNPAPMTLKTGTTYRFRLVDISPNDTGIVSLRRESGPVLWKAVSKDGAALPPIQSTVRPAIQQISVGETYDFEYAPDKAEDLRLEVHKLDADVLTTMLVHVTN